MIYVVDTYRDARKKCENNIVQFEQKIAYLHIVCDFNLCDDSQG